MKWAVSVPVFLCYLIATFCLVGMVLMGLSLRWLYEKNGYPVQGEMGNCWAFAYPKWVKNPRKTYLAIRLNAFAIVPHVFFAESIKNLKVEEFKPIGPIKGWKAIIDSFWFKGKIRKGLGEE